MDTLTKRPIKVIPLADKQPLEPSMFNSSSFEVLLTAGYLNIDVRDDTLPSRTAPKYEESIAGTELSLVTGSGSWAVQPMIGLVVAVGKRPLEDYLDWKLLSESFADAYRLIFARAMVEILDNPSLGDASAGSTKEARGEQQITAEAVILEPVFVYIVEGLLGMVSLSTIALLYLSLTRRKNLQSNPGTIASIMSLVSDSQPLLSDFEDLDYCTVVEIEEILGQKRYKLVNNDTGTR